MPKGMTAEKVRNLTEEEMRQQEHDLNDQLFRLKFQMKMGQTESLKKIRGLRKDIARIKTIARERVLGNGTANGGSANGGSAKTAVAKAAAPKAAKKSPAPKAEARTTKKAAEKKTATGRK
jgi:large subunit ribosomal protein L29